MVDHGSEKGSLTHSVKVVFSFKGKVHPEIKLVLIGVEK